MSYKGETVDPAEYLEQLRDTAARTRFTYTELGHVDHLPIALLTHRVPNHTAHIYLSAGVHGDEPAGPLAILRLLEFAIQRPSMSWTIFPLLNPTGLRNNTRENAAGIDLNRDYRHFNCVESQLHAEWLREHDPFFDLALCLHEDWESTGFYLYEHNPDHKPDIVSSALDKVKPICGIEEAAVIDGWRATSPGLIRPDDSKLIHREFWPEAVYLIARHTRLSYTLETPSAHRMSQRIAATEAAACTMIDGLKGHIESRDMSFSI